MQNWYCIYTKPKVEDNVCGMFKLDPMVEVFNPKLKRKRFTRGKLAEVIEALFPSYVFIRINLPDHYKMVKYTRGVRRFVGDNAGSPLAVDEDIIRLIRERMDGGFLTLERPQFREGDQVVIKDGPFGGFTGIFKKELNAGERVMILLKTLSYQANIEIERSFLAKP
jgi:transcription elongation factor/antiterminator RfaH